MKRLHLSVAFLGLAVLSTGAWWWQHRAALPAGAAMTASASAAPLATAPLPVEVAQAIVRDLSEDVTAIGSLRSRQGVVVRPEVSGRVVHLGFQDGERVRRGQLLAQLDDALQRAQLRQAEAQLAIARTNLRRNQELVAQNFVTQSVVDQVRANVDVAEAQVALARAQLDKLRILAPFDGQTGIRAVNVGDYLKDGDDIVTLEDSSSMYVDFSLPERYVPRLALRQPIEVVLDALPGELFTADVVALEPQITADGRAIAARATVPNPDARLRAGMFARVRVLLDTRAGAVLVPEEAVVPQAGKNLLIKVVDGPIGPTTRRVEVRTGLRRDGQVEIVSGLSAGERVVTAGQARLLGADALPVQVIELGRSAPPARPASNPAS